MMKSLLLLLVLCFVSRLGATDSDSGTCTFSEGGIVVKGDVNIGSYLVLSDGVRLHVNANLLDGWNIVSLQVFAGIGALPLNLLGIVDSLLYPISITNILTPTLTHLIPFDLLGLQCGASINLSIKLSVRSNLLGITRTAWAIAEDSTLLGLNVRLVTKPLCCIDD